MFTVNKFGVSLKRSCSEGQQERLPWNLNLAPLIMAY